MLKVRDLLELNSRVLELPDAFLLDHHLKSLHLEHGLLKSYFILVFFSYSGIFGV
jgi:hypothetical protein